MLLDVSRPLPPPSLIDWSIQEAARKTDPLEQLCWVAAYAVSSYSTTGKKEMKVGIEEYMIVVGNRTTKPFNPLLGETYECDRMEDLGWRSISEQVRKEEEWEWLWTLFINLNCFIQI